MFIAAAAGWTLANLDQADVPRVEQVLRSEALERRAAMFRKAATADAEQAAILARHADRYDAAEAASLARFGMAGTGTLPTAATSAGGAGAAATIYRRKPEPKGPMDGFGYSWLDDHLKRARLARPALLDRPSPRDGPSFGYEALNLVDGQRNVQDIRDELAATVAPAPLAEIADYLAALEKVGLIERR